MGFQDNLMRFLHSLPDDRRRWLRTMTALPGGRVQLNGRELVNFASNDYLGLAAQLQEFGSDDPPACSSRLICGGHPRFNQIEQRIAELKGTEAALLFGTGFQANASVLESLLSPELHGRGAGTRRGANVQVFSDRLIHASFQAGLRAARIKQYRYRHNDLDHLAELLRAHRRPEIACLILTESVFSMDGDRTPIRRLRELARESDAWLYVDEAHATGVLGHRGMGLMAGPAEEIRGREGEVILGTFSKALASFGAYVACSHSVREYLINRCPGLIYSTALPPGVLARTAEALERVPKMEAERKVLGERSAQLRGGLRQLGLDTGHSDTQIVPVTLGSDRRVLGVARDLEEQGWLVGAIRPPTVPEGTGRLRFSVTAAHSAEDIDRLLLSLARTLEEHPV